MGGEWGIIVGIRMGQCWRDKKYKGEKGHTSVGEGASDLSIQRALSPRFGEMGIQFGNPEEKRNLAEGH